MSGVRIATGLGILAALSCISIARASPISGTFDIDGSVLVTATSITWEGTTGVPNQAMIGMTGLSGSFAGLGGTTVTVEPLNSSTEPASNSGFPAALFLTFNAAPSLPPLLINMVFPGIYAPAGCAASPPAVGQTCTPSTATVASPFNLVNNPPAGSPQATASWAFSGVTGDGLSSWSGNFTSQFTVPFQTVLAQLGGSGTASDTFSAAFTITAPTSTTPEPETLILMVAGFGLIGISLLRIKKA